METVNSQSASAESRTIAFAGRELERYLRLMANDDDLSSVDIALGLFSQFAEHPSIAAGDGRDDAYVIDVSGSQGIIAGSNPRSVLHGVYRFLEMNGCRWIRPGADGDIVPRRDISSLGGSLQARAAQAIRGFNDCGAYPLEVWLDKIAWAPKVGLNAILSEFFAKDGLYNRYYLHPAPSRQATAPRSSLEIAAYHHLVVDELELRGIDYHAIGHGWTGRVCGLSDAQCTLGSAPPEPGSLGHDIEQHLALVDGVRAWNPRGAVFTELCIGTPATRQRLVETIVDYADQHPEIDVLHVWASDSSTTNCECELCTQGPPSNLYLRMLNELDAALTQRGLSTTVAFLIYAGGQLLYPPTEGVIENPDRFLMMFAPIGRDYSSSYDTSQQEDVALPELTLNKRQVWTTEQSLTSLRRWKQRFSGRSFAFEYHFTWHHYYDPGQVGLARSLAGDIKALPVFALSGYVGCETVAAGFPTAVAQSLKARLLYDSGVVADEYVATYLEDAFGEGSERVREYLQRLSEIYVDLLSLRALRRRLGVANEPGELEARFKAAVERLSAVPDLADDIRGLVEEQAANPAAVRQRSWRYLLLHLDYVALHSRVVRAALSGSLDMAEHYWQMMLVFLGSNEQALCEIVDLWYLQTSFENLVGVRAPGRIEA